MQFIYLLLFLASLYGLMILLKKWLSIPYAQIPFVTIISLMSVLYVAGLFGLVLHVSYLVFLTGLGCFVLSLYNKPWTFCRRLADNHSLLPLATFGVLYLISWFIWKNITFSMWDEFGWGLYTKIITTHDSLIAGYNDISGADYPRITAILQYYFILFLRGGDFHEGTVIFAQTIIFLSAVPVFLNFRKYNLFLLILIACCFYCLFCLFVLPICLIYNDSVLGLCWGMSVILYLINRKQDKAMLIITSISLFSMVQVKPIGIVFAFFTLFIVAIDEAFFFSKLPPAKLKKLCVLIAVVLISHGSWSAFKSYSGITHSPFTFNLEEIYRSLSDPKDYQKTTAENFLYSLIYTGGEQHKDRFIGRFAHPFAFLNFSLSPLGWALIFAIFMSLCCLIGNTSQKIFQQRSRHITLTICLIAVLLMYTCLLLFLFLTTFSEYEAVRLASFDRYLGTVYLGIFLVLFFLCHRQKNKGLLFAFIVLIFLFTPISVVTTSVSRHRSIEDFYGKVDPVIEKIKKDRESKTLVIDQGGNRYIQVIFHYRAFPLNTSTSWSSVHTEGRDDWGLWQQIVSAKQFGQQLREYDYLIVWNDTEFWERYGDAVKQSELKAVWALNNDRLAKVNIDTIGVAAMLAAMYSSIVADEPIIRSHFDVYLNRDELFYIKEPCSLTDTEARFLLDIYPIDTNDLPDHRRQDGYGSATFQFQEKGVRFDEKCIAQVMLPAYEINYIRAGQWAQDGSSAWETTYNFSIDDRTGALFGAIAASGSVIHSIFDVYPQKNKLIYFQEPCTPDDTKEHFYLHLIPADENDLPANRKEYGFDNYDFVFSRYGTHFDGKCMAYVPIPEYEIASIRTGQYIFDREQGYINIWSGEAVNSVGDVPTRGAVTRIMSPPTSLRLQWAQRGNGEVALQWITDSDMGTIEKHKYRQSTDSGATWSNWTDISETEVLKPFHYLVTGLTNGVEYTFQVRVENRAGKSVSSVSASVIPAAVPKMVRNFAVSAGNGQATLTWANPNDTTITKYQYDMRRPYSDGRWTGMRDIPNSNATMTNYTVRGLTNDSLYAFTMKAVNSVGASAKTRRIYIRPIASK